QAIADAPPTQPLPAPLALAAARAFLRAGKPGQATQALDRMSDPPPLDAHETRLLRAVIQGLDGQPQAAASALADLRSSAPPEWRACAALWQSKFLAESGAMDAALAALDHAARNAETRPAALLEQARLLMAAGQTPQARKTLGALLQDAAPPPLHAKALLLLADVDEKSRDLPQALASVESALALSGGHAAQALWRKAVLLHQLGRQDESAQALAAFVRQNPDAPVPDATLAWAARQSIARPKDAILLATPLAGRDSPLTPGALAILANAHAQTGDWTSSAAAAERLAQEFPASPWRRAATLDLAQAWIRLGRAPQARALLISDGLGSTLRGSWLWAQSFAAQDRHADAERALRRMLALHKADMDQDWLFQAHRALGLACLAQNKRGEALEAYRAAVRTSPPSPALERDRSELSKRLSRPSPAP
ncbi:MAG TPA: tetratricopeptide repeat protein, partial [Candidatus Brocadiia bacterium]|nr:tetratricopeptide repeat protein [Candidatus Brocadiia bacterium]